MANRTSPHQAASARGECIKQSQPAVMRAEPTAANRTSPPQSASAQGECLGQSLHAVLESALRASSSTRTDPRLSLMYQTDSRLTTVHDGHRTSGDGLLAAVLALEGLGVLGADFSVDTMYVEYWPGRIQVKTAGTLLCKVSGSESGHMCRTYFRDVVFAFRRVSLQAGAASKQKREDRAAEMERTRDPALSA